MAEPKNNICLPFYIEVQNYLSNKYKKVLEVNDYYKKNFKNDDWFSYYKEVKDFGIITNFQVSGVFIVLIQFYKERLNMNQI